MLNARPIKPAMQRYVVWPEIFWAISADTGERAKNKNGGALTPIITFSTNCPLVIGFPRNLRMTKNNAGNPTPQQRTYVPNSSGLGKGNQLAASSTASGITSPLLMDALGSLRTPEIHIAPSATPAPAKGTRLPGITAMIGKAPTTALANPAPAAVPLTPKNRGFSSLLIFSK